MKEYIGKLLLNVGIWGMFALLLVAMLGGCVTVYRDIAGAVDRMRANQDFRNSVATIQSVKATLDATLTPTATPRPTEPWMADPVGQSALATRGAALATLYAPDAETP